MAVVGDTTSLCPKVYRCATRIFGPEARAGGARQQRNLEQAVALLASPRPKTNTREEGQAFRTETNGASHAMLRKRSRQGMLLANGANESAIERMRGIASAA
jgi:hypothetical protein